MAHSLNGVKHFLSLQDFSASEIVQILHLAMEIKKEFILGKRVPYMQNKILGMIFEKSSTRTRVSFEAGIYQLGGTGIFLSSKDIQLGRGEPMKDTARVISSMVDMVMIRTSSHQRILEFAKYSSVPVINALTDDFHPMQLLADYMTMIECGFYVRTTDCMYYPEHKANPVVAYIGDGNNMAHSWLNLSAKLGFDLRIASPKGYEPRQEIINDALQAARDSHARIEVGQDIEYAVKGANVITTDTWASMGQESQKREREIDFRGYCVDSRLMALAHEDAIFLHCLPAYRGQEVSEDVLEGKQSRVFQEAQNRLHCQKGVMVWLDRIHNLHKEER